MLTRMFGLFGLVFGLAYLNDGVIFSAAVIHAYRHRLLERFLIFSSFISLDFFFGTALLVAAFGLLFATEWGRKLWLMVLPALVITHLIIILFGEIIERPLTNFYLVWTAMVGLLTVMSWWKLSQPEKQKDPQTSDHSDSATSCEPVSGPAPRYNGRVGDDLSEFFRALLEGDYHLLFIEPDKERFVQFALYMKDGVRGLELGFPRAPWSEHYYKVLKNLLDEQGVDYDTETTGGTVVLSFINVDFKADWAGAMKFAKLMLLEVFKLKPDDEIEVYLTTD